MAKIPKSAIKGLVKRYFKANITDAGAEALAKILEKKAESISKYAVENAKKENRDKVTGKDVAEYVINGEADVI